MIKKEQISKQEKKLRTDASNLQRFIHKFEKEFEKLTDCETEVLTLVAKGFENAAIARQMNISRATVQNQKAGIRKKLSIENQADYVKYALAFGLVSF